jgi:hypothetical protein
MVFTSQGQLMEAIIKTVPCPEMINSIHFPDADHVVFSHNKDRFIVDRNGHVQSVAVGGYAHTTNMSQLFETFLKKFKQNDKVYSEELTRD